MGFLSLFSPFVYFSTCVYISPLVYSSFFLLYSHVVYMPCSYHDIHIYSSLHLALFSHYMCIPPFPSHGSRFIHLYIIIMFHFPYPCSLHNICRYPCLFHTSYLHSSTFTFFPYHSCRYPPYSHLHTTSHYYH